MPSVSVYKIQSTWHDKTACRKLTSNIHSSHDLNRPEAKRFRVKLANLNIPKIDLVKSSSTCSKPRTSNRKTSLMNTCLCAS